MIRHLRGELEGLHHSDVIAKHMWSGTQYRLRNQHGVIYAWVQWYDYEDMSMPDLLITFQR